MRAPCKIDGCERESAGRGWCKTHWGRWRKHGDPLIVKVAGTDYRVKGTCKAPDCRRQHHSHDFCTMHLVRWQKNGDPTVVGERGGRPLKGDIPTWGAIHRRLSRTRGPARNHDCVDCGGPAREWSYNGKDDGELMGKSGRFEVAFSENLDNYEPRCCSCHRKFDNAMRRDRATINPDREEAA